MERRGTQIVQRVSGVENSRLECQRFFNTLWDTQVAYQGYVS